MCDCVSRKERVVYRTKSETNKALQVGGKEGLNEVQWGRTKLW